MAKPRASLAQDLLWRLEALGFDLITALFRALPIDWASAFGGWLLKAIGPLNSAHRTARKNLELAFPEKDDAWREQVLMAQWENVGRAFAEFPSMDKLRPGTGRVEVVNGERLREIAANREPVVFISGHFSNWEVMPAAILESGVDCLITYRPTNNPYVDKRIREGRARYGVKLFAPKGESARELMQALGNGQSIALMNDQKFNGGLPVPFFGVPAYTAPGPTKLALKHETVLQPMSVQRTRGARFRAVVHEPIRLAHTNDRAADVEAGVRQVNAFVEDRIRERPEEWFWVHKRWPNEIYKGAPVPERVADPVA